MTSKSQKNHLTPQSSHLKLDKDYLHFLNELKSYISSSRIRAALALNKEVIQMYWSIGKLLVEKQKTTSWGDKLYDQLIKSVKAHHLTTLPLYL